MPAIINGNDLATWMALPVTEAKQDLMDQCAEAADAFVQRWCTVPATVPEDLTLATLQLGAFLYRTHLVPEGVATFGGVDGMGVMRVGKAPLFIESLLAPFVDWAGMI